MLLLPLVLLGFSITANAATFYQAELVCPIGGGSFTTTLAGSGFTSGRFLDLKPFGPTPAPWPLAKCPSNGFVLYQSKFTDSELDRLKEFVESPMYQEQKSLHTNYYLAAVLQRHLKEPPSRVAFTLLQATWEARGNQYQPYASEALEQYKILLSEPYADKKKWLTDQLIAGELERRLERFEDAHKRFSELKGGLPNDAFELEIVDLQMKLISERKSNQQLIPSKKK